jgi:hypothetical protein
MKNQTASPKLATEGQKGDIIATLIQGLPKELTFKDAQSIIENKGEFLQEIRRGFEPFVKTKTVQYWLNEWTVFYRYVFSFECDFSSLRAPVSCKGFGWLLVADERLSTDAVAKKCAERFPFMTWPADQIGEVIGHDDRSEKDGTYAIWLRDAREAEETHMNKAPAEIYAKGIKGTTLRERLLLELWHHWQYNKFLDTEPYVGTLCTGTIRKNGYIPDVQLLNGEVLVGQTDPRAGRNCARCREIIAAQ